MHLGPVEVPRAAPETPEDAREATAAFSRMDTSPSVNLATRIRHILRLKMKADELAERLVQLARSGDERIASASLETVLALQGVIVPKKPEEHSDQRFFVISGNIVPKVDVEIPPQSDSSPPDKPPLPDTSAPVQSRPRAS